jgi:hypothetical protein
VTAGEATPRPWRIGREGETIWIEGPRRSTASERFPADRRIVCEFRLYGDEELDAETKSNFELIVEAVNAR